MVKDKIGAVIVTQNGKENVALVDKCGLGEGSNPHLPKNRIRACNRYEGKLITKVTTNSLCEHLTLCDFENAQLKLELHTNLKQLEFHDDYPDKAEDFKKLTTHELELSHLENLESICLRGIHLTKLELPKNVKYLRLYNVIIDELIFNNNLETFYYEHADINKTNVDRFPIKELDNTYVFKLNNNNFLFCGKKYTELEFEMFCCENYLLSPIEYFKFELKKIKVTDFKRLNENIGFYRCWVNEKIKRIFITTYINNPIISITNHVTTNPYDRMHNIIYYDMDTNTVKATNAAYSQFRTIEITTNTLDAILKGLKHLYSNYDEVIKNSVYCNNGTLFEDQILPFYNMSPVLPMISIEDLNWDLIPEPYNCLGMNRNGEWRLFIETPKTASQCYSDNNHWWMRNISSSGTPITMFGFDIKPIAFKNIQKKFVRKVIDIKDLDWNDLYYDSNCLVMSMIGDYPSWRVFKETANNKCYLKDNTWLIDCKYSPSGIPITEFGFDIKPIDDINTKILIPVNAKIL